MTSDELSAKVAVARGDSKVFCTATHNEQCSEYCPKCQHEGKPRPYATDMNAADELMDEMQRVGRVLIIYFNDSVQIILDGSQFGKAKGSYHGKTKCDATCNAYLAYKVVE